MWANVMPASVGQALTAFTSLYWFTIRAASVATEIIPRLISLGIELFESPFSAESKKKKNQTPKEIHPVRISALEKYFPTCQNESEC